MNRKKLKKYQNPDFVYSLIKEPEEIINVFDLVYVDDSALVIKRKEEKKGFIYLSANKPISDKKELNRIKRLAIPPVWKKVKISKTSQGHLQAVGRDEKLRKQYIYHELWKKIRNQTKFFKMASFGKQLPKIRKKIAEDINQKGWPLTKTIALVIRLMEETHIRIGNDQYAKKNKTYGLSTLRKKHIDHQEDSITFHFIGKKGKEHNIELNDDKLIKLVNQCEEIPGWELFKYYDENNEKQTLESGMINDYLHNITEDIYTAKDFRTWAATVIFFESLYDLGLPKKKKKRKKRILKALDKTSEALGNTRNICRKYYVHPALINKFLTGTIQEDFDTYKNFEEKNHLSASEQAVLQLIENYVPSFLTT
ncbi:DNA topoisomerase-1 [Winogradskyella wandonensis]|uniref:DNA topoisomerase n=1 Tax=Winogradskyella wandonensis TaxID=1442586 RepID=A0A4R1KPD4_9FLAO|nr:DNA topoisomerase IB [Winogradskyella wandonensis]TCK66858.1 DNA topoisomerase-1 [Winogradskyella wandonensis]